MKALGWIFLTSVSAFIVLATFCGDFGLNAVGAEEVNQDRTGKPNAKTEDAAKIAKAGLPDKGVAACVSCHGATGEGNSAASFPRLAGQPADYLARQLSLFASGTRNHPVMTPIAKGLNPAQIRALSTYYESLAMQGDSRGAAPAAAPSSGRGRQLVDRGDEKLGIQACANCHGPGGAGEAPVYPYLAGQGAGYLTASLQQWKSGARNSDPSGQMAEIGKRLPDPDITALAAYFSSMQAPATPSKIEMRVGGTALPAGPAGKQQRNTVKGGKGTEGVGTEQGAPITGGGQGIGGGGGTAAGPPGGARTK
ncbi:MAG: hypothetical protein JWN73_1899 [Betaproteobacteria bacterium]|nr:hypothetical protein [Betaproteobacteria bacterium]